MRALVQRVSSASVIVDQRVTGEIGAGLLVFVCVMQGDTETESIRLARKVVNLRIFEDAGRLAERPVAGLVGPEREQGRRMNRSLLDVGGSALVVSQFTLAAETEGNRPGFSTAASPDEGERLYEHFSVQMVGHGVTVANGVFGADMDVALVNNGPVTIWLDTASA
jgi:D-aminoacyl-tRNA deacylase